MPNRCTSQNRKDVALHRAQERFAKGPKAERLREVKEFELLVGSFLQQIEEHYQEGKERLSKAVEILPDSPAVKANLDYFVWGLSAVHYMQHQLEIRCRRIRRAIDKNDPKSARV